MMDEASSFEDVQQALDLDRVIHEPARLVILAILSKVEWAEFKFLLQASGLSKGNLSKQSSKLEESGYIEIEKTFRGKIPLTRYRITPQGKVALAQYWQQLSAVRANMDADSP